ncbi:MAG: hypothetical protein QMD65_02125 [Patescibacteria group bacterium]|nr:hypothetical protein [Patescibacteria group bacterium]
MKKLYTFAVIRTDELFYKVEAENEEMAWEEYEKLGEDGESFMKNLDSECKGIIKVENINEAFVEEEIKNE